MTFFDSHAHYWDERFTGHADETDRLLKGLLSGAVSGIVNVGTSYESSLLALAQARQYPGMYAASGLHPQDAQNIPAPTEELEKIRALLKSNDPKLVALGEIGLDYHYDGTDRELQKSVFDAQLSISEELRLPVIIHDRDAHGDVFDMLLAHPAAKGVIHSFSGSPELAREFARRGWYISFSGTVSFRNAAKVAEAAKAVPDSLLLIETDCPYLTPHPYRGKRNDSGYLVYTADALAAHRGISLEECARLTEENARRLFCIPEQI